MSKTREKIEDTLLGFFVKQAQAGEAISKDENWEKLLNELEALIEKEKEEAVEKTIPKKNEEPWEGLDTSKDWDVKTGMVREGYNQAIDDMKKALKGE